MKGHLKSGFRLAEWQVYPLRNRLVGPEGEVHIEPKVMQVLEALALSQGQVVEREKLLLDLWNGRAATDEPLTHCISALRHALGDSPTVPRFIQTFPKRGYRLICPVEVLEEPARDVDSQALHNLIGRKLGFIVIGILAIAIVYLLAERFFWSNELTGSGDQASIAVLPFVDLSPDGDQEYFSDGISEEILNALSHIPELRVASRTSAFSFKGQNLDVPTIAARLNVANVLEGSVRKSGNQLRITAQLVEVETDTQLWSETYDRELENVFAIQDEIAARVVDALKITMLGSTPKATETDPDAYALYLQAKDLIKIKSPLRLELGEKLLKQALEIDPRFVPAWTDLGDVYSAQAYGVRTRSPDEVHGLARHAIERALAIDPQYGRAHAYLGDLDIHYTWDFSAASRHIRRALQLNPGDTEILRQAAHLEDLLGRVNEAIDLSLQWVELDPLSPGAHISLGRAYFTAGRLEQAAASFRLARSLSLSADASFYLCRVLLAQGDAPAALAVLESVRDVYFHLLGMAWVRYALGDNEASDAALQEFIAKYGPVAPFRVAEIYAFRGEIDNAFIWLDRAYDHRDVKLPFIKATPEYANLHDDPRWDAFLEKMGLPH